MSIELHLLQMGTIRPVLNSTTQHCTFHKPPFPSFALDRTRSRIRLPRTQRLRNSICRKFSAEGSFLAYAESGRVECSSHGCKPFCEEDPAPLGDLLTQANAGRVLESRMAMYHQRVDKEQAAGRRQTSSFHGDFAQFLSEVWKERATAEKYYEAALREDGHDARLLVQYAQFAWSSLENASRAERLFEQAIKESPCDPHILGSYAHFLWQCEG